MEVILLEKIANLGDLGDKVSIKAGYGRNYLLPQGKAVVATAEKIKEFETLRVELEQIAAEKLAAASAHAIALSELTVVITHKAGDEGKLFGSVGTQNIADALTEAGVKVEKHEVRMPTGVIRQIGNYNIDIHLHSDVIVTLSIEIAAEA
ncbi:MAG: 50S ribosomal protein L9 [Methylococcales symbiont of Iophon sp. n. MRB-2018]|nr:MAG: 50S ribosomal protein L9 [Methylococcales symbiont of Iophon sp. n. MRB-2018]KAF3979200.1 MAG: 50S ribosomal protein L9 [Methylococcales symbiont of Iophon sp. n. MRB-2018]